MVDLIFWLNDIVWIISLENGINYYVLCIRNNILFLIVDIIFEWKNRKKYFKWLGLGNK